MLILLEAWEQQEEKALSEYFKKRKQSTNKSKKSTKPKLAA